MRLQSLYSCVNLYFRLPNRLTRQCHGIACYCGVALLIISITLYALTTHSFTPIPTPLLEMPISNRNHSNFYHRCSHHSCFRAQFCAYNFAGINPDQIRIYVYPHIAFLNTNQRRYLYQGSGLFREILNALNSSRFAVHDPNKACLFVHALNFEGSNTIPPNELLNIFLSFPW